MANEKSKIVLGMNQEQKRNIVEEAIANYGDVDRIFVFYGDSEAPNYGFDGIETIYTPWKETEKYRTFYPLLGSPYQGRNLPAITAKSLLIVDEMLMNDHRNELKYNCTHHFMRVSERRLVFNYFPFLSEADDFMILVDFAEPDRFKKQGFSEHVVDLASGIAHVPNLSEEAFTLTDKEMTSYQTALDKLFAEVEDSDKDPNIVPRNMALKVGNFKKKAIREDAYYVARNHRIKSNNVVTYGETIPANSVYILDPTYKKRDLCQFLRNSKITDITYLKTQAGVDSVYFNDLAQWVEKLEEFYEATGLSK